MHRLDTGDNHRSLGDLRLSRPVFPSRSRHVGMAAVAIALVVPILALDGSRPSAARAATHAVSVQDGSFSPAGLTVAAGDTVTWTNDDDSPHTVTAADGSFDSGNLEPGQTFSFTFAEAGSVSYLCQYHEEMTATVTIAPAAAAPSAAAAQPSAPAGDAGAGGAPQGSAAAGSPAAAAGAGAGQPDTALGIPSSAAWLAPVLVGLGLVTFAFGIVPSRGRPAVAARTRGAGMRRGWRR